jgi:predicted glycosyltransferase
VIGVGAIVAAPLRVAVYSQDGFGLGHLRRTTLIGQRLLQDAPESAVLLLADSPVAPFFQLPKGMDCLKLPSILKVDAGKWRPVSLNVGLADLRKLRGDVLRCALLSFAPDLLLVDHMPGGVQGELVPSLMAVRREYPECRIVLGLRDILDAPPVIARVWEDEGAYEALRTLYVAVLIYGSQDVFDAAMVYDLPTPKEGIHYCGYVANPASVQPAWAVRQRLQVADRPLVFVSAGGGGDAHQLMRTYLRALRCLGPQVDFTSIIAVGANAPSDLLAELRGEADGLPVRIVPFVEDSLSVIAAADLMVCMAGYNTLAEVLRLGRRALVVPRAGPSAEQRMRSQLFLERGLVDVVFPEDLSPERLAERIVHGLRRNGSASPATSVDTAGLGNVSGHLLRLAGAPVGAQA